MPLTTSEETLEDHVTEGEREKVRRIAFLPPLGSPIFDPAPSYIHFLYTGPSPLILPGLSTEAHAARRGDKHCALGLLSTLDA